MRPGKGPTRFVIRNLSRREFLRDVGLGSAGLVLYVQACGDDASGGSDAAMNMAADAGGDAGVQGPMSFTDLDVFLSIGDGGAVRVTVHRSEMGQGVRTSCAMLVAEELGARWQDVEVVQAPGDAKYGDQNTDSSASMVTSWEPLRKAGATVREMLAEAAAQALEVDRAELTVADSEVIHADSDRRMSFAELAPMAAKLDVPADPPLRAKADRRIIGKRTTGVDVSDIVQGKAIYGIDVEVKGMLHASIERSPTVTGKVLSYDEDAALAIPGVRQVVQLDADDMGILNNNAVAVVAETTWAAMSGRAALNVQWDLGSEPLESSPGHRKQIALAITKPAEERRSEGDVDSAFAAANKVVEASYRGPYLAHAPMEPLACTAEVVGDRCEVWAPTQNPQRAQAAIAGLLGIPDSAVTVHVTLLGGGFGRKSQPDFVLEAVALAKEVGAPVKVTWTREDEIRHGFYRPENAQLLRAALDAGGKVTALLGRSVFSTIFKALAGPSVSSFLPGELDQGWTNLPFDIANVRMEAGHMTSAVRIGWLRSVCNTFHAFAVGSFVDELAQAAGTDAVSMFKQLLGSDRELSFTDFSGAYTLDTGRLSAVVDRVAGMGLWGKRVPAGEGIGFAAHVSFRSYVAAVIHVAVGDDKIVRVKEVDYAVDVGTVVNPDGVEAQVEGGLVFGLSAALFGEITVQEGAVVQGNFDTYPMLRIDRMPKVNVAIIDSDAPPTGIGEPPTPVVAPALTNAIFAATGVRLRDLPVVAQGYG